ncbi:MAG: hypothetical protein ACE5JX_16885 [Acidobacteriota bacterium]
MQVYAAYRRQDKFLRITSDCDSIPIDADIVGRYELPWYFNLILMVRAFEERGLRISVQTEEFSYESGRDSLMQFS